MINLDYFRHFIHDEVDRINPFKYGAKIEGLPPLKVRVVMPKVKNNGTK